MIGCGESFFISRIQLKVDKIVTTASCLHQSVEALIHALTKCLAECLSRLQFANAKVKEILILNMPKKIL